MSLTFVKICTSGLNLKFTYCFSLVLTWLMLSPVLCYSQKLKDPKIKKGPTNRSYSDPKLKESPIDWKATRTEFMIGAGPSNFLGDLGGQDDVAQPFVFDLEPTLTRYSVSAGVRYFVREYHAVRGYLSFAEVRGDDALTSYPNRRFRNLNFKSPIVELAAIYEFHLIKPSYIHLLGANTTKLFNGNRFGAYVSGGAGLFYFNPKGKLGNDYHALKPLNTAGQGFPDGPNPYQRLAFGFPLGGGAYVLLNKNFTLGLDFAYRWTTTDYIDDATGYYYDNTQILERDGKLAAYFANPSVALSNVPNPDWYTKNQPRGNAKSNDTYMFLQVTLSKSFTPAVTNRKFKQSRRMRGETYKKSKKKITPNREKRRTYKTKGIKNSKRKFKAPKLNFGKRKKKKKVISF